MRSLFSVLAAASALVVTDAAVMRAQDSLHMTARSIYPVFGCRDVWGYESFGQEYALVCLGDRLEIVNCTDPDNPAVIRVVPSTSSDLKDVKTYQNYAYAINQYGPMQIINLADPATAVTEAHYSNPSMPSGHNLFIDTEQGYAYPTLNGSGARDMRILDLAVPTAPVEVGHYAHPGTVGFDDAHDAYARHDTAWVSYLDAGLAILDVSNKSNPVALALLSYPGSTNHNVWVGPDGDFVYTTDERSGGHVRVWDTRDMLDIREVAAYFGGNPSASVHNVHINGEFCFVSYYTEGVRVLDIEDPADPIEVAYYDTYVGGGLYSGCWGVYPFTSSGYIYASDRSNGLFVLEWDSTQAGRVQGTVTLGHDGSAASGAYVIKQSRNRIQVADGSGAYSWRVGDAVDTLVFERTGFVSDTVEVQGILGSTQTLNVELSPVPTAQVIGRVTSMTGTPLSGARVGVVEPELFDATADAAGDYQLDFVLADTPQTIIASVWGYRQDTFTVNLSPGAVDTVDFSLARGYEDHFELDLGWTVGASDDDATEGLWVRADPVGTQNFAAYQTQPEVDFDSTGAQCYFTGQALPGEQVSISDVDSGQTSLVSPLFSLTGIVDPVLSFRYWYVNNAGPNPNRDTIWFELSADTGQTWVDIASSRFSINSWWPFTKDLSVYQGWPQPLLLRIRAVDHEAESIVELGIDDFEIVGTYPDLLAGDLNQDGNVSSADIVWLVNFVFKGGPPPVPPADGDLNGVCGVTSGDVIWLVNFVFKGGPEPLPSGC